MIRRTPYIFAYTPYDASSFEAGAYRFSDLLRQLAGLSPYVRTNTLLTTEDQMESGIGLDPINNMKEVVEVFREHFPDNFTPDGFKSIWGERWEGGENVVKIKFKWGGGSQSVSVWCPPPNSPFGGALVSTIDSGHLGALYGGEAKEAALIG